MISDYINYAIAPDYRAHKEFIDLKEFDPLQILLTESYSEKHFMIKNLTILLAELTGVQSIHYSPLQIIDTVIELSTKLSHNYLSDWIPSKLYRKFHNNHEIIEIIKEIKNMESVFLSSSGLLCHQKKWEEMNNTRKFSLCTRYSSLLGYAGVYISYDNFLKKYLVHECGASFKQMLGTKSADKFIKNNLGTEFFKEFWNDEGDLYFGRRLRNSIIHHSGMANEYLPEMELNSYLGACLSKLKNSTRVYNEYINITGEDTKVFYTFILGKIKALVRVICSNNNFYSI